MGVEISVVNPFNRQPVGSLMQSSAAEVESAMAQAHALYCNRKRWLPPHERIEILQRTIDIMSSRVDELTQLALSEGGNCLLYTSPSPRDGLLSRMPSSA